MSSNNPYASPQVSSLPPWEAVRPFDSLGWESSQINLLRAFLLLAPCCYLAQIGCHFLTSVAMTAYSGIVDGASPTSVAENAALAFFWVLLCIGVSVSLSIGPCSIEWSEMARFKRLAWHRRATRLLIYCTSCQWIGHLLTVYGMNFFMEGRDGCLTGKALDSAFLGFFPLFVGTLFSGGAVVAGAGLLFTTRLPNDRSIQES